MNYREQKDNLFVCLYFFKDNAYEWQKCFLPTAWKINAYDI